MNTTLLIKTFQREESLLKLLKSIAKFYPDVDVIIVDDSKTPKDIKKLANIKNNINYIHTDFNIGISKGRNIGIQQVKTDFFILLDDDFCFTRKTKIEILEKKMIEGDLDILSFKFLDYGICPRVYRGKYEVTEDKVLLAHPGENSKNDQGYYDFVLNCFIGRTDFFKKHQWDNEIKVVAEHHDFFYRIMGQSKIDHTDDVSIWHCPCYSPSYSEFRDSKDEKKTATSLFLKKNNLSHFELTGPIFKRIPKYLFKILSDLNKFRCKFKK